MLASPFFDKEGNLLGTDDEGLQSNAIRMDKKDFKQGMSHKRAIGISILCLSILILTLCYLFLFKYSSKSEREIALLLGIEQVEIISFDYEEDWNHKDYDIIEIYKLSDNTITEFQINSTYVLCEELYEKHLWMKLNWTKTPIDLCKWHEIYNMVIEPIRVNDRHNKWISRIKSVINKNGNYYSLYHKDKNPIAMYILDTNDNILYCIYYKI